MEAFSQLDVFVKTLGGTTVMWRLAPEFVKTNPGPYAFTVLVSRSGVGDWTEVGTAVDVYFMVDVAQQIFARGPWPSYKVEAVSANGRVWHSRIVQGLGNLSSHDQPIAADILRKERLLLVSKAGRCGWLYKRRHWGTPCSSNVNQDTGEVIPSDENTDTCYGTGFAGGYFDPVEYPLMPSKRSSSESRRLGIDLTRGNVDEGNALTYWRGIGCPWLDTDDVWVDAQTDKRYFVQRVYHLNWRGQALIFDPVELRMAAADDVIYRLPRSI